MIGNVIQSNYLVTSNYPAAAALAFILMLIILLLVVIYIRFAGSEALMGDEASTT
jgi:spermidine/putrescine transport system permease protein